MGRARLLRHQGHVWRAFLKTGTHTATAIPSRGAAGRHGGASLGAEAMHVWKCRVEYQGSGGEASQKQKRVERKMRGRLEVCGWSTTDAGG